jgi:hypothetical protein
MELGKEKDFLERRKRDRKEEGRETEAKNTWQHVGKKRREYRNSRKG